MPLPPTDSPTTDPPLACVLCGLASEAGGAALSYFNLSVLGNHGVASVVQAQRGLVLALAGKILRSLEVAPIKEALNMFGQSLPDNGAADLTSIDVGSRVVLRNG